MKILIVHSTEEQDTLGRIRPFLEEMSIRFEIFSLKSQDEKDLYRFTGFFDQATLERDDEDFTPGYILILSSLPGGWFDFLAGYSQGSRLPLLVYGQEIISSIPKEFAPCFTSISSEAFLRTYLEFEAEAFKSQETAKGILRAQENLLKKGVPVTGESLSQCIAEGRIQEVAMFLAAGFSPDTRNKAGVTMLNVAARNGKRDIVKFLLVADANVNLQAEDRGTTALIDSVMRKHYDIMEDLIKAGTDVNIQSRDGQTALIVAVGIGDETTVAALLEAGSDPDIQDSMGASARQYANLFHKDKLGKYFKKLAPGGSK